MTTETTNTKSALDILAENYSKLQTELESLKRENSYLRHERNGGGGDKIVHTSFDMTPYQYDENMSSVELLAGLAGAISPRKLTIYCRRKTQESGIFEKDCSIDLMDVRVMGVPCLMTFFGSKYIDSKFFEKGQLIEWPVFGASSGQGLNFKFRNPHNFCVSVSIIIQGYMATMDRIGNHILP